MEGLMGRKGAGYSIEAILSAVILFTFAMGAVNAPDEKQWGSFQREIAARDISFVLKRTGDLNTFLKNSDVGAIQTASKVVSGRDLEVSGTIENLPLNELRVGFHTMPYDVHQNFTRPVESYDVCHGDLNEIEAVSEEPVLRTKNVSGSLESKHNVTLYFGDNDPRVASGYNNKTDYDTLWVDNGTRCIFKPVEGPYLLDDMFMWGNTTDSYPETHYDFKKFNNSKKSFTIYKADKAVRVRKVLSRPLNGIKTDTFVDTFNFSSNKVQDFNIIVFKENKSLERIEKFESDFRDYLETGSVLFLMNMTRSDTKYGFMEDIGFEWAELPYASSPSQFNESFSDYSISESVETYFKGLEGRVDDLTLGPGGKIISSQDAHRTSRDDMLFARNLAFDTSILDGVAITSWSGISGICDNYEATFGFKNETYHDVTYEVENVDLARNTGDCGKQRGLKIDNDEDPSLDGPYLPNEVLVIDGRRYVPKINGPNDAKFVFAGSRKVELVNHRRVLDNETGLRVARMAYESNYSQEDMKMLGSVIYWLRGDEVQFKGSTSSSSVSSTIIGGVNENVFMPYKIKLRWGE